MTEYNNVDWAVRAAKPNIQHDRAVRGTQVIQRFASTLCLREIRTRLIPQGVAPAWSTSNTITFVENDLADLGTTHGVLNFKGLSLHEIAHILFTPRAGSDIVSKVMEADLHRAFNALEDQRIETLLVGRFGDPIVPWLTATVVQHILSNPQNLPGAFALVRGRKYLPIELRRMAMDAYGAQQDVAELSSIIDEYRTLLFPADTDRAIELIARYAELVKNLPKHDGGQGEGCGADPDAYEPTQGSRPLKPKDQKRAQEKAQKRDEQDEAEVDPFDFGDPADDEPEEQPEADQPGDEPDEDDFDEDGTDEPEDGTDEGWDEEDDDIPTEKAPKGNRPTDNGDGSADGDEDGDDGDGDESAEANGAGSTSSETKPVEDLLKNILDDIVDRLGDSLRKDVRSIGGDVELETNDSKTPPLAQSETQSVDPEVASASKAFGLELERLKAKYDPDWERLTKAGKLNASRFMRGYDIDEVFDKWQTGREDAVDIEATILVDISNSMGGARARHAGDAMWGLKRALDKVQASTTVLTFNTGAGVLYKSAELAGATVRRPHVGGGTDPRTALKYAQRVLAESDRAIKVLFVVTDGEWFNAEESEEVIKTLRTSNVLTALAYIDESPEVEIDAHSCEVVSHITAPRDLLFLGRQLVKLATARQLSK